MGLRRNGKQNKDYILIIEDKEPQKYDLKELRKAENLDDSLDKLFVSVCFDPFGIEKPYVYPMLNRKPTFLEKIGPGRYILTLSWWDW